MKIKRFDHIVLSVTNLTKAVNFYHEVFDLPVLEELSTADCKVMHCGHQLLYLQQLDALSELTPKTPTSGSADLCLVASDPLENILNHLKSYFIEIIAGPKEAVGANGKMHVIYLNDPDGNLIELAVY